VETPPELDGSADLVYTGRGALCWLLDLEAWAQVVARLLAPGGCLYLFESHPACQIFDGKAAEVRLIDTTPDDPEDGPFFSYFSESVAESRGWLPNYIGELERPKAELSPKYERQWTLAAVLNPLLDAGLRLERLGEHPDCFWPDFPNMDEKTAARFPHTFSLLMRKPALPEPAR
jgi:hypothetical protein